MNENLRQSILYSTFQHLPGIGPAKEQSLWKAGIEKWDDFEKKAGKQLKLFQNGKNRFDDLITDSKIALQDREIGFFLRRLSPHEHFRIPLSLPDEVVFLDIETTGLSIYYDKITLIGWSKNGKYKAIIGDNNYSELLKDLKDSTTIVTYNGTIFDIRFLKRDIPELEIPECHIDLRYACLRKKLTGGQKSIEQEIGFQRSGDLKELKGENAPTLWYQYQYGDNEALKRLMRYNLADIEGMQYILDHLIDDYLVNRDFPIVNANTISFFNEDTDLSFSDEKDNIHGIYIPKYTGDVGPKIKYEELKNDLSSLDNFKVVGIDLSGSEKSETGWALIESKRASYKLLTTDEEIIQETTRKEPHLISIDSPLSLPKGRKSVFDDDPGREEFGIMRECERILKRRGINVYPSLIPSMQKLTKRGISLATKFRNLGYPVIESYPGAVQDIIGIPRKGTSIEFLRQGLIEFGLMGISEKEKISHDELDAITSAIVGLFFWIGKYEAIGNKIEEYLIIPDLEIDNNLWLDRWVVGISGPIATGKTTAAEILEKKGFVYGRYSMVIEDMLRKDGKEINRSNLQILGEKINKEKGQRWLGYELIGKISEQAPKIVVDGLRFPEDHAFMIENFGPVFSHIYIEASEEIRKGRYNESDEFEKAINHQVEQKVKKLKALSTLSLKNEKSMKSLEKSLFNILNIKK